MSWPRLRKKAPSPETLPPLADWGFVYLHVGAPERALEFYEERAQDSINLGAPLLWHPTYAAVRKMERFKKVARDMGLVNYWRERGWPEFCRPVGAEDFECD